MGSDQYTISYSRNDPNHMQLEGDEWISILVELNGSVLLLKELSVKEGERIALGDLTVRIT